MEFTVLIFSLLLSKIVSLFLRLISDRVWKDQAVVLVTS